MSQIKGVYNATPPTVRDGQNEDIQLNVNGDTKVELNTGGVALSSAANTDRTTATKVIPVQHIDGEGTVGGVTMNTALNKDIDSISNRPIGSDYAIIDLSTDAGTTVCGNPCVLTGIYVDVAMSAHTCPVLNDTTTVFSIPASSAAGYSLPLPDGGVTFPTNLIVNSNDAATGTIVVFFREL